MFAYLITAVCRGRVWTKTVTQLLKLLNALD